MTALQSYWRDPPCRWSASARVVFLVEGVASILFLIKMVGRSADPAPDGRLESMGQRLPRRADARPHRLSHNHFAFTVFGSASISSARLWAEERGAAMGLGPQVDGCRSSRGWFYAAYTGTHDRQRVARQDEAAWNQRVGVVADGVFTRFFINLVTVGLHSYAGVG